MDITNEQTDKSGSNKPPLLPKPCLGSISSGPPEHVIPQMVITSPDDNESLECASETATVPDILVSESPPCDVPDDTNDADLHTKVSESYEFDNSQPPIQPFEVVKSENETNIDESVPHSAIQRPLVFESEKCSSEPNIEDTSIPSTSQSPSPLSSIPPVTSSQRPMVFGGSNAQLVPEEEIFEQYLDDDVANTESQEADGIVLDELNLNEDCKTPEPDIKPKSSSFSWMPTFPKLHASGKDSKTTEAGSPKKDAEVLDHPKSASSDQMPVKKDGLHNMKKFFDNLRHDTSSESKDISSPDNQNLESSSESAKKVPKEGKQGIKKLFSSTKQDSKLSDKDVSSETKKDTESVAKEHHKDSKSNIKKMFDSFKTTDKKDVANKKEQDHPHTEDTSAASHESKKEGESKEHSKESKSNLKRMFDSFKPIDKKDGASKKELDHLHSGATSSSHEPKTDLTQKEDELKEHSKESKSNLKKMFDSFKHVDKKDSPTKTEADVPQVEVACTQNEPKKAEDSKSNLKKMFDTFKPVEKKEGIKKEIEPVQVDTSSDVCKTDKGTKSPIKKFFESFKHEDVPVEAEVSKKTAKTDDLLLDKKDLASPKLKSSLKQSSTDLEQFDYKETIPQDLNPTITSQDASKNKTDQSKQLEAATPRQSTNEHGVKKFFQSFRSSTPSTSKEQTGKFHVTFLDGDSSLKRSHSFQESILIKDSKSYDANEKPLKDKFSNIMVSNETVRGKVAKQSKSKEVKRSQSCKETLAEKQGFHGIRGFFDSITHKTPKVPSQTALSPSGTKREALTTSSKKEEPASKTSRKEEALPPSIKKEALPSSSEKKAPLSSSEKESVSSNSKKNLSSSSKKDDHIYDTVGKPEITDSSQVMQESTSKPPVTKGPQTSKGEHSGVRKLFDSFLHKESPSTKEKSGELNGERIYEKIDISSSVESSSHTGRTFMDMKRERIASIDKSEPVNQTNKPKKTKEATKVAQSSPDVMQEKKTDTKIPSAQVNGPSASTDAKHSVFHSISDNFIAIKDRVLHSKEKKNEVIVNHDKVSEEYDLESAASKNGLPDISAGTFRPLKEDSILESDHKKETEAHISKISDKSADLSLPSTSKQSNSNAAVSKPLKRPDLKANTKVEPGTPDTLYDTCCVRLAHLLGKKALEIVSDKTKTPPKKPPKPSADAIAKARAEVVSQRLRNLQNKGLSIGESIPVGYDGIRFADDETESSCDYKDVDNLDYVIDYELLNRYKFDGKGDTFSAQSVCSISSYYTADTVTLKDENFSDAPLETISLGSNESLVFQNLSANSPTDFNSLPAKIKAKNKNIRKLKELDNKTKDPSNIPSLKKKVPPPLPPKPVLTPKSRDNASTKKDPVSQCINGLSLSPRLQSKFSQDAAATQKRPLFVAGLRGTEFTSLQTKSKDTPNKRTFNTVLKNESLKKISPISPLHAPLQSTKSSPSQFSETQNNQQSTRPKKVVPERPPPPFSPSPSEDSTSRTSTGPPVPEKPKREHKALSPQVSGKRTISPIRPPLKPPVAAKIHSTPPPRPPPPVKQADKQPPYQNLESHSGVISTPHSLEDLPGRSYSYESESDKYDDALECAHIATCSSVKFVDINLHESSVEKEVKKIETSPRKFEIEHTASVREDFTTPEPDSELAMSWSIDHSLPSSVAGSPVPTSTPKPPPRTRRIRSRTVEIASRESVKETLPRRSQSLTEIDVQKRTESLNVPLSSEKVDLKILYTSVNKHGKRPTSNGSQSPSLGGRPLPAPPPPPRKFRSLDRKPKEKKNKEQAISHEDENKNSLPDHGLDDALIKPPERKKKVEKHRFHSLSTERKKTHLELTQEDSRIPRSNSVPLKPDRRLRHSHEPEYDENANVAFPVVAEVHRSAIELDECGNEILESPKPNIPPEDTVDSAAGNSSPKPISPHPRQKKDKNAREKSHSSWYDEHQPSAESWDVVDWDPNIVSEESIKEIYSSRKKPLRRRSDPVAGRKERRTSQFYVNVDLDEGLPLVDKETSPLHLDCSEKSVQTSLETLSQGLISRDEQNLSTESSDNTDHLLSMVKTLQTELKTTLDRHKALDSDEAGSSSNAPTDSEKSGKPRKLSKSNSIHSTTPELWPATSSEESDGEVCPDAETNLSEIALTRKRKKVFYIAQEIMTSEEVFVDTLKLLNVDFKSAIEAANKQKNTSVVPDEVLSQILNHLPQLQHLNENLLMELKDRIDNWNKSEKIADVIVKMGPFLKLYSWFIHDFESNLSLLEESKKKYPLFAQSIKEFEASARCKRLTLNHFMLKPIQRIPQYRLLLQEYLHNLTEDSPDYQDTVTALQIVSEVANHANDSMKQGDNAQKLISIQNSIMGHKEIIKPGRLFIKEGELMKLSRKGMQPRWFVLFNDLLLYLTPVQQGLYRINHELPLTGMRVAIPLQQDYQNEFSIISVTRSFTLAARSHEEREEWINVLEDAIKENASKRSTFTNTRLSQRVQGKNTEDDSSEFVLGRKAPVWIPDARVTMCQLCTSEFTVTFRRHHCRACGKVVCSICSNYRIPLAYIGSNKVNRVCDECYSTLGPDSRACLESGETDSDNQQIAVKPHLRYVKKYKRNLPSVLKEVCANDQGSTISGYLQKRVGKSWKREWFVVKDKVLYEYKASEDVAALRSTPLLGYRIESFSEAFESVDSSLLFQLTHPGQAPIIFYADSVGSTERWIAALKEASVLE